MCKAVQGWFWHNGCPNDTSMKLRINFQISNFLESVPTPGFSRVSSKCHPWSLRGCWWFLREVFVVFDVMDVPMIHQGSYISIFISLPSREVLHLLCVSRASSWSLKRRLEVPKRSLGGFWDGGCPKDTLRKLHTDFQVSTFLGSAPSPIFLQSVIMESKRTLEVPSGVLVVFDMMDVSRIHHGSYVSIFKSLPSWKVLHLLCVSRASSWSLRGRWKFLTGV